MTDGTHGPVPARRDGGMLFWVALTVAVGALVLVASGAMLAIYVFRVDAFPIRVIAAVVPIPAASVNGTTIRYAEWVEDTRAFVALAESGEGSIPGAKSREEIGKSVMQRLVRNRLLEQVATEKGITVTDAEVDAELANAATGEEGKKALAELLHGLGWSENELKEKVLRPAVLARHLADRLGSVAAAETAVEEALANASVKVYVRY